jgi:hypothetical protein
MALCTSEPGVRATAPARPGRSRFGRMSSIRSLKWPAPIAISSRAKSTRATRYPLAVRQAQLKHSIRPNQLGSLRSSTRRGLPRSRAGAVGMRQPTGSSETKRQIVPHLIFATGSGRLLKQGLLETLGQPESISLPERQAVRSRSAGQTGLHFQAADRLFNRGAAQAGHGSQIRSNSS